MELTKTGEKGIPGSTLKIIAIVAMFLDHFGAMVLEMYLAKNNTMIVGQGIGELGIQEQSIYSVVELIDVILRLIGRFGFPIFCFLLVEGFQYTSSVKKYALNLTIFALISEIPFDLALKHQWYAPEYQNVYFTLLIGLLTLTAMKYLTESEKGNQIWQYLFYPSAFLAGAMVIYLTNTGSSFSFVLRKFYQFWLQTNMDKHFAVSAVTSTLVALYLIGGIISMIVFTFIAIQWEKECRIRFAKMIPVISLGVWVAEKLHTDYGGFGVLVIVVMYLTRQVKKKEMFWGCVVLIYMNYIEASALLMLKPVERYNGKRGISMKYFFYAFYPCHILFMYFLACLLGLA